MSATFELYDSRNDRFFVVTADYERQAYDPAVGMRGEYIIYITDVFDGDDQSVEPTEWMEAAFAQELYDRDERRSRP